jgi:cytoskeletal protein CcmA (bactofilin family)
MVTHAGAATRRRFRPFLLLLLLAGIVLALWATPVAALERRSGDTAVSLEVGETINDDLAIAGDTVTIAGHVTGDVFAAGTTITVLPSARIDGDLVVGGNSIIVNGPLGGSIRAVGNTVQVNGAVGRNVLAAANQITLGSNATVNGNWMTAAARTVLLHGTINGTATMGAERIQLAGVIGRDVELFLDTLTVPPSARLGGSLTYTAATDQPVPAGVVQGQVQRHDPPQRSRPERNAGFTILGTVFSLVLLGGTILIGLLIAWRFPGLYRSAQTLLEQRALLVFGAGLVALIVTPVLAIILMITVLGLPLGVLSLGAYAAGWYIGWVLAATALAGVLVGLIRRTGRPIAAAWLVLLGLIGLHVLTRLPFVGALLTFVVVCLGLGILVVLMGERLRRPAPPAPSLAAPALPTAPAG